MNRMKSALKTSTIINPGMKLDTSEAPYVVVITPEELHEVKELNFASIKEIAIRKGVPRHVADGKFRASPTDDGLMMEWEPEGKRFDA